MKNDPSAPTLADPQSSDERSFGQAMARIRQYRQLPDNWDSEGSQRPAERAVDFAERLLTCLQRIPHATAPFVAPIDGGVYVEWRTVRSNLYLEIDASSVLTVRRENGAVTHSTEISNPDLDAVIALIEQFHEQAK